jgi:hypothetical protein
LLHHFRFLFSIATIELIFPGLELEPHPLCPFGDREFNERNPHMELKKWYESINEQERNSQN